MVQQGDTLSSELGLGQPTHYPEYYDPSQLQRVPRALNREPLGIQAAALPFYGFDHWTAYELSWLNPRGLPQVAMADIKVPAESPWLIESKSFKLYLNSLNHSCFTDWQQVQNTLSKDLSECAGAPVQVALQTLAAAGADGFKPLPGEPLDHLPITIEHYNYTPELLQQDIHRPSEVHECLHTHLLKSNCLVTNQPDWGSLWIEYQGPAIDREALLRYVVSFRHHNEFHEQCVERIFFDLKNRLHCYSLTVGARYTRRGGLDINPWRSDAPKPPQLPGRQVRQ